MGRQKRAGPTDAELEVLRVLWESGGSTVRQISRALAGSRLVSRTSVPKIVQLMADKGLVRRLPMEPHPVDGMRDPQIFVAAVGQTNTQRKVLRDLIDRLFGGSPSDLIMRAISAKRASPAELEKIRRHLKDLESQD
ncbi:MAG TPA: BlaI/MecI/CopY family transcriptional regulator [Tepidisphaeraceae bacterium]|nr:BlaI/MecI/CopY family transcriptional regulator [Tepidisphaeraceae bacterium]